jgi:hypothetical protein
MPVLRGAFFMLARSTRHLSPIVFSFLLVCGLLACFFSPMVPIRHAQAKTADGPIAVVSDSPVVHFPNSIDFHATVTDSASTFHSAQIDLIVVQGEAPEVHTVSVSNGHTIYLVWHEDTSNNFAPPGNVVTYRWELTDNAGNSFDEPVQHLTITDTRFTWQEISQGNLNVHWYNRSSSFGQEIFTNAQNDLQHIGHNLGGNLLQPVNLWVYETVQDFQGSLPPGTYEWVGGVAFPTFNFASIVVQSISDETVVRDMPHELTHLMFHQLISDSLDVPRWFDEGMAVYNQLYHESEMNLRFELALKKHNLLRLNAIAREFPADSDQAYLAYAESWNLLTYMYNTFGVAKMAGFIKAMNNPAQDFDTDMTQALGEDSLHLENNWLLSLHQPGILSSNQPTPTPRVVVRPTPVPTQQNNTDDRTWVLLAVGGVVILLALAGLVAAIISVSQQKKKMALAATSQQTPARFYPPQASSGYMNNSMYASPPQPMPVAQQAPENRISSPPADFEEYQAQEFEEYTGRPYGPRTQD